MEIYSRVERQSALRFLHLGFCSRRIHPMKRCLLLCIAATMLFGPLHTRSVVHAAAVMAPRFEVDPFWPKPLPNHWILGQTIGVSADTQDHIWIIHRVGSLEAGEQHATTTPHLPRNRHHRLSH